MRLITTLAAMFLAVLGTAFGQNSRPAGTNSKPQTTTFMHQTLGESWEDFMSITGTKMNPCGSQQPQSAEWCEAFKKIQAGEDGEISTSNGTIAAALFFSKKTLMKVEVHGKADFYKSVVELSELNGPADSRTDAVAVWNFADGGEIRASVRPDKEVELLYYCKDAKQNANPPLLASTTPAASVRSIGRTDFRGFVMGAAIDDLIKAGFFDESVCVKPNRDTKVACKEVAKAKAGEIVGLEVIHDNSGTVRLIFENQKLVEIEVRPSLSSSFAEQLSALSEKYGAPTSLGTHTEANAMGARWDCGDALWQMPDGSVISAYEFIEMLDYSGPTRVVMVDFKNADRVQRQRTDQQAQTMKY
jgi:hypothetical protein